MNIPGKRSDLPFSRNSDRKEKSVIYFTNEEKVICSQTHLDDIAHEQTIICMSLSQRSVICLSLRPRQIIDLLATDKSRYFAQPRPIVFSICGQSTSQYCGSTRGYPNTNCITLRRPKRLIIISSALRIKDISKIERLLLYHVVFMHSLFHLTFVGSRDQSLILECLKTVKVPKFEPKSGINFFLRGVSPAGALLREAR